MDLFYGYLRIFGSCIVIYLFIIISIRLFGKKELAQLSVVDLVFILLISNAVQNAMVGDDSSLVGGLVAAASLFIVNYLIKVALYRFPRLSKIIQGHPMMLVYQGKLNMENLKKSKVTVPELMEAIREHGVGVIEDVDLAVLEIDGNISILSDEFKHRTTKKRKPRRAMTKNEST
jgi:uncharacterized membrane protein YcaP (DUF421 family)